MTRLVCVFLLLFCAHAVAVEKVRVLALFTGKAMLEIDGKRKVLSEGQANSGVKLLLANPRFAKVLINGEVQELKLGSTVKASFVKREQSELRLLGDSRDSFFTDALVNGQRMRMLVDTGATTVAMSEVHARKLGLAYVSKGNRLRVGTASGTALGYQVSLRSLKVGEVKFQNVNAIVIEGDSPQFMLLGMNILSRFEMEQKDKLLILRRKF